MKVTFTELRKEADNINLGIELLEKAIAKGYSQIEIAEFTGLTSKTIGNLKRQETKMTYNTANALIKANSDGKFN